jgi:predicted acyltransferase
VIILALALCPVYPIIKKMWTIPFNLLTLGIGAVLLSVFYNIIDVKKHRSWTLFFRVIGMNAITIYLPKEFVSFGEKRWYDIDDCIQ